jgi:hypothetical protein
MADRAGKTRVARNPSRGRRSKTHSCATTTPRVRRAIQASEETNIVLAKRHGVNRKTIAKWKAREFVSDERMGPKNPRSTLLTLEDEAIILAYRWRTRLALDDAHLRLKRLMPNLSRSMLYRCLKRRGLSRIGPTATCPPLTEAALRGPYRFEITTTQVAWGDPGDVIGVVLEVFLSVSRQLDRSIPQKDHCGCYRYPSGIHRLESGVQRRHGLGQSSSLRRRLPLPRDRSHSVCPSLCETPENPSPRRRNSLAGMGQSDCVSEPRLGCCLKRPWGHQLSIPDTRMARSASKSVPHATHRCKKALEVCVKNTLGHSSGPN